MNTPTTPFRLLLRALLCSGAFLLLLFAADAQAGSATWNLNPTSGDWNTAANWMPNTVPNGPSDIATFVTSTNTSISLSVDVQVSEIDFGSGSSAYAITLSPTGDLTISGSGVINNSGVTQRFVLESDFYTNNSDLTFTGSATAGRRTIFTVYGGDANDYNYGPQINFEDTSSADRASFEIFGGGEYAAGGGSVNIDADATAADATFITHETYELAPSGYLGIAGDAANAHITNDKGATGISGKGGNCVVTNKRGGVTSFDGSTADAEQATVTNEGGNFAGDYHHGLTIFANAATGGNAVITSQGGNGDGAAGGETLFSGFTAAPRAGNATLIANSGVDGGEGGSIVFSDGSVDGGTARFELFGNGTFDITGLGDMETTIGSIEGDGTVLLGSKSLTIGTNNSSTTFSGVIQDAGSLGSLTKIGTGKLVLTNANTYAGGTTLDGGTLLVSNTAGSGLGTGPVQALSGILGGSGVISGRVTMGTGRGNGATLGPGANSVIPGTLTIGKQLAFKSDATYRVTVNSRTPAVDLVIANGIRILGAQIVFNEVASGTLPPGTTLTVISNTSNKPFSGTFANLADGSTVTIGSNTYQANYEGGDGNDLTLTVVQ